jgi:ArsR family transcriptional regulator
MKGLMNEAATRPEIFDRIGVLGDPTRVRLLHLLERRELTVSELCAVTQLPQSTVSRHLRSLADGGWVSSRREGTSRWYALDRDGLDDAMRRLWTLVRSEVAGGASAIHDLDRLPAVLRERRSRSREFFSTEAGQWDHVRDGLFGGGFFLHALPALLDPDHVVGDLGCGTGQIAGALAPFVREVIAIDDSESMRVEAQRRLELHSNVDVRAGDLESLPLDDASLDAATVVLVLHHVPDPGAALAECARVLKPGGRLLAVDMLPHDRQDLAQNMGHVWMGFAPDLVSGWMRDAGFEGIRVVAMPADPRAKGPALFVASATRGRGK